MDELAQDAIAEEAVAAAKAETPVTNEELIEAAEELSALAEQKGDLEAQLTQVKDREKQLKTQVLPDLMSKLKLVDSAGKGSFTFRGGRIHLESRLHASCSEAGKLLLYPFLRENGAGDIIKETVNAQTLSALVRERRGDSLSDPPGISVHEEVAAKFTRKK